jgi:hypothetical protein
MNTVSIIEQEIATLPNHLRAEVLDFVQFIKQRHGLTKPPGAAPSALGLADSPLFNALTEAGVVGCIDTQDQSSVRYKSQLDFSNKLGHQP